MDVFGFPPLEVEQATMVIANITDPIDLPWNNTDNLFTRLITLKSIRRREERIIKRLKGKRMFGEIPFMLRLQISRHLLDRGNVKIYAILCSLLLSSCGLCRASKVNTIK